MKTIKPFSLGVLTRVVERGRRFTLSVGALAFFPLDGTTRLFTEAALWKLVGAELPNTVFDAALPKARPEVLVTGRAFAPQGRPCTVCRVRVCVGPMDKTLQVCGDRHWLSSGAPSTPEPFTEMPVSYERAFGGPGFEPNPSGKGFAPEGDRHPLPNTEDLKNQVRNRDDRPPPAGYGSYDSMWPQRRLLAGTYDEQWLQDVYPGYPDDMDPLAFNTAPEDQRMGVLRGDEAIVIENMHPERPLLAASLPGLVARCFVTQRSAEGDTWREVSMSVETVHLFPHVERGVVILRGTLPVQDPFGDDVLHLVVAAEHLGRPKSIDHYQEVLAQRLDPGKGHLYVLRDRDLLPEDCESKIADEDFPVPQGLLERNADAEAARQLARAREQLADQGVDPNAHLPAELPPRPAPPSLDELPQFVDQTMALAAAHKAKAEAQGQVEDELRKQCAAAGIDFDQARKQATNDVGGLPRFSAERQMQELEDAASMARNAECPIAHIEAQLADPMLLGKLQAVEGLLRRAYLASGHYWAAAPAVDEATSARIRAEIAETHAAGGSFRGRDFTRVSLTGMSLLGADFRDCLMEGVDLSETDVEGADFSGAVLVRALLVKTRLARAKLVGANLGGAQLHGTDAQGADFSRATLARAEIVGADLSEAILDGADVMDVVLRDTRLCGASAPGLVFMDTVLSGLKLSGARLSKCVFVKVTLTDCTFTGAALRSATFLESRGEGTVFRDADMSGFQAVQGCSFEDADFSGATLSGALLRSTKLARSLFVEARMSGADLSESDLHEAVLRLAVAREARFVKSDLTGASMVGIDLLGALLGYAILRGTDLRHSRLSRADLLRVTVDAATKIDGAETTDMRFRSAS